VLEAIVGLRESALDKQKVGVGEPIDGLSLMAPFGADAALPDVLMALASCDRRRDFSRPCGARFTDLAG
jgi:hypothetical protein